MSTAKTKQKIAALAHKILQHTKVEKDAKDEKDRLKAELSTMCDSNKDFFTDGKWKIDDEAISIQMTLNPPKAIFVKSEEALKPEDRHEIAQQLGNQYILLDIDFKKIQSRMDTDKDLKKALKKAGITIVQETRYDIKRIK